MFVLQWITLTFCLIVAGTAGSIFDGKLETAAQRWDSTHKPTFNGTAISGVNYNFQPAQDGLKSMEAGGLAAAIICIIVTVIALPITYKGKKIGLGFYVAGTIIELIALLVCVPVVSAFTLLMNFECAQAAAYCYTCTDGTSAAECSVLANPRTCFSYETDKDLICNVAAERSAVVTTFLVFTGLITFTVSILNCMALSRIDARIMERIEKTVMGSASPSRDNAHGSGGLLNNAVE